MKINIREKDIEYLENKFSEIEGEIAVVCGVASLTSIMAGKTTDTAIKARDNATENIKNIVYKIIRRVTQ